MLRVGLTGGIASGKSFVAAILRKHGYPVLDLDALGHQLMEPGSAAYKEIVREFGGAVLGADAQIDRAKLGAIVFADVSKRGRLNQILHPPIREEAQRWFALHDHPGGPKAAFVEAALLIEAGYRDRLDHLIVCWCKPEQQLERLLARGLSAEQAQARIAAQMPIDEKRRAASHVIDCSGTLEETERQVDKFLEEIA